MNDLQPKNETTVINFNINDARIAEAKEEFKDIDAYKDIEAAKQAKKTLTKMRTTLAAAHKEQKAEALAHGQRLDAEKRRLLGSLAEVEDPITEQLDAIKNAKAIEEANRVAAIQTRIGEIVGLGEAPFGTGADDLQARLARLGEITVDESFDEFYHEAKTAHAAATQQLTASIAAAKRAAEEAAALEKQRKEQAAAQAALDKQREEQEARDRELKTKQDAIDKRQRADAAAEAKRQREAQERIDSDRRALEADQAAAEAEKRRVAKEQADAEEAERLATEAAEKAERLRPDTDRLASLADTIECLDMPDVVSDEAKFVIAETRESLAMVANELRNSTKELA